MEIAVPRTILLLVALAPFWAKPPAQWTDEELARIFTDSPWAQSAVDASGAGATPVYIASVPVMRQAEAERARRSGAPPADDEYQDFLHDNEGKVVVLAVAFAGAKALDDPAEARRLQEECTLKVGKKKLKMTGYFPPLPADPYLRLVFPYVPAPGDRLVFELYLPSLRNPYRMAQFRF